MSSKTGACDSTVPLDLGRHAWIVRCLEFYLDHLDRAGDIKLFGYTYAQFMDLLKEAADSLSLGHLNITAHSFRHGGASHDRALNTRSLLEVQQRGQWRSTSSVLRYDKHGRLALEWQRIPTDDQEFCRFLSERAPRDFTAFFKANCALPD